MSYFAFTYRLKPTPAQAVVLNNVVGCVRYAHNKVLADAKEDYQEYLEELESRLIWGEARTSLTSSELDPHLLPPHSNAV